MMAWVMYYPEMTMEKLGFIPFFLEEGDPRSAREQLDEKYNHGGGWRPFSGFELLENGDLQYPGDPPARRLAATVLHDEKVYFYEHAWVMITQPDGSWEVARMD